MWFFLNMNCLANKFNIMYLHYSIFMICVFCARRKLRASSAPTAKKWSMGQGISLEGSTTIISWSTYHPVGDNPCQSSVRAPYMIDVPDLCHAHVPLKNETWIGIVKMLLIFQRNKIFSMLLLQKEIYKLHTIPYMWLIYWWGFFFAVLFWAWGHSLLTLMQWFILIFCTTWAISIS